MSQVNFTFIINNSKFPVHLSRSDLNKIPEDKEKLFYSLMQYHQYEVESKVKSTIFQEFLNYWKEDKIPQIEPSNIWEYYQLSNEFGLLNDYLSQKKFENYFNLTYLLNIQQCNNINKTDIEKKISQNLDYYLINYPNELQCIQINSLYNIFNHPERILNNHDIAYNFIIESSHYKNKYFYILLESLDTKKIKIQKNKRDSLINQKIHLGYSPKNVESFILEFEKNQIENVEKINQIEKHLKDSGKLIEKLESEKIQQIDQIGKLKSELKDITHLYNKLKTVEQQQNERIYILESQLKNALSSTNKLEIEKTKSVEQLNSLEQKLQDYIQFNNKLESEKNQLKYQNETLENKLKNYKNSNKRLESENCKLNKKNDSLNNELMNINQTFNSFKLMFNSYKKQAQEAIQLLNQNHTIYIEGIDYGNVSHHGVSNLRPPKQKTGIYSLFEIINRSDFLNLLLYNYEYDLINIIKSYTRKSQQVLDKLTNQANTS